MSAAVPLLQDLADCAEKALVGMKAVNLGRLIRGGFPVPGGFAVTTHAYRARRGDASRAGSAALERDALSPDLLDAILSAYRALGSPPVAVRSSATAEDMVGASMAGQYDTFLDITDEHGLIDAVRCCWASVDSPRTRTYFAEHGIDVNEVAMAVIVQRLVPADVAGVLFTANPKSGTRREMLVEASWGLGEAVVSGRVQPDVLRIEHDTGRVIDARIADKQIHIPPGGHEERPVDEPRRRIACLRSADVHALWRMGARAAAHFAAPQDLEWALHNGELFLLQTRPITTLEEAEAYEQVLQAERTRLREADAGGRGPWVIHNLGETLPHPTPLTWSVIRRFMSGDGGFGTMYREAGFSPSPIACRDGFLERIAGRIYMDLARAPEMFLADYPFRYDAREVRRNPDAANAPPTLPTGSAMGRLAAARKVGATGAKIKAMSADLDQRLREQIIPAFVAWCEAERAADLTSLSGEALAERWRERQRRVLDEFAPQSLLPGLVSGMALAELQTLLHEHVWDEDPRALADLFSSARPPDRTVLANAELYEVARGSRPVETWLADHGHRAPEEFDLATPRWREQPPRLEPILAGLRDGADPIALHKDHVAKVQARLDALAQRLSAPVRRDLLQRVELTRRYVAFREDGKDYLMLGYALLRETALEIGRRLEIGDGIFFLQEAEALDALRIGFAPLHLIAERRRAYRAESRVALPQIIDSDSIDTLGEPPRLESVGSHPAFALSSGVASGPARVLASPDEPRAIGKGYVLVCRSTDPAWTPLFVNAAALVMECGGALSHGAVVAREMGIPAVVLPNATTLFADGETLTVDGHRGAIARGDATAAAEASASAEPSPDDDRIEPALIPPPRGRGEQLALKVAIAFCIGWSLFLAAALLLPETWLYEPSMRMLDALLWPGVRALGRPTTVAIAAAAMALLTMLGQRLFTDNGRLREAKRRSSELQKRAASLPADSRRRRAMTALAGPVQGRLFVAALVPLCLFLGPMILTFLWFPARVDPASWNAPPGGSVNVVATVDSNVRGPIELFAPAPLALDELSPPKRRLPPIRERLDRLLSRWRVPSDLSAQPWDVRQAADDARRRKVASLESFLKAGVPPQSVSWQLHTTADTAGTFPVTVSVAGAPPVTLRIVLGDRDAPSPVLFTDDHGPLRSLKIVYPATEQKRVFWAPFARLFGPPGYENAGLPHSEHRLARIFRPSWDAGWLLTYLAAYLPAMYLFRKGLGIA